MSVILILILSIVLSSLTNQGNEDKGIDNFENNKKVVSQAVIAKVYVKPPNFDVLDEKDSKVITLILFVCSFLKCK